MTRVLSVAHCALYCHVYRGFIQTIPRQITGNNDRITETIELLRLLELWGLDCDISNLISVRVCVGVWQWKKWERGPRKRKKTPPASLDSQRDLCVLWKWNKVFRQSSSPPVLLAEPTVLTSKLEKRLCSFQNRSSVWIHLPQLAFVIC